MPERVLICLALLSLAGCVSKSRQAPPESISLSYAEIRARMNLALELPGVNVIGDAGTRVFVGLVSEVDRQAALAFAANAGVPASTLDVRVVGPIHSLLSMRDLIRPVTGGIQITSAQQVDLDYKFCTLGVVAVSRSNGQTGFITNSHCTKMQGGTEYTYFGQPDPGFAWSSLTGKEQLDPTYAISLPGCPAGRMCRMSDAAFVGQGFGLDAIPTNNFGLGRIAKPMQRCVFLPPGNGAAAPTPCGLQLESSDGLTIVGLGGTPTIGQTLDKIGRTSGWTTGIVSATCANVDQADSNFTILCQTLMSGLALPGDSGSPVFSLTQNDGVVFFGLLWGGSAGDFANGIPPDIVFSPIDNITSELGALQIVP